MKNWTIATALVATFRRQRRGASFRRQPETFVGPMQYQQVRLFGFLSGLARPVRRVATNALGVHTALTLPPSLNGAFQFRLLDMITKADAQAEKGRAQFPENRVRKRSFGTGPTTHRQLVAYQQSPMIKTGQKTARLLRPMQDIFRLKRGLIRTRRQQQNRRRGSRSGGTTKISFQSGHGGGVASRAAVSTLCDFLLGRRSPGRSSRDRPPGRKWSSGCSSAGPAMCPFMM